MFRPEHMQCCRGGYRLHDAGGLACPFVRQPQKRRSCVGIEDENASIPEPCIQRGCPDGCQSSGVPMVECRMQSIPVLHRRWWPSALTFGVLRVGPEPRAQVAVSCKLLSP